MTRDQVAVGEWYTQWHEKDGWTVLERSSSRYDNDQLVCMALDGFRVGRIVEAHNEWLAKAYATDAGAPGATGCPLRQLGKRRSAAEVMHDAAQHLHSWDLCKCNAGPKAKTTDPYEYLHARSCPWNLVSDLMALVEDMQRAERAGRRVQDG